MKFQSSFLVSLLLLNLFRSAGFAQQTPELRIAILAGAGEINDLQQRTQTEPVIEVRDANGSPIEGATVVFFLPNQGPGGTFLNGSKVLTATTDRLGRAVARGIQYSRAGSFSIRVTASYRGQMASATISQTNIGKAPGGGFGFGTKAWIILGICIAAVAGTVIAATHNRGSSSSGPGPIVITPGTPTVGAPQ